VWCSDWNGGKTRIRGEMKRDRVILGEDAGQPFYTQKSLGDHGACKKKTWRPGLIWCIALDKIGKGGGQEFWEGMREQESVLIILEKKVFGYSKNVGQKESTRTFAEKSYARREKRKRTSPSAYAKEYKGRRKLQERPFLSTRYGGKRNMIRH